MTHSNIFKLPIEYDKKKKPIQNSLQDDLELVNTKSENTKSIYDIVFRPSTKYGKKNLELWSKYYTTHKDFLKESKDFYKKIKTDLDHEKINIFQKSWDNVIQESAFVQKYQYLEWNRFIFLNHNEWFLQGMSMYNLTSPVFTLVFPLVALIVPFFILKLLKQSLTFDSYKRVLFMQLKNHVFFRVFTNFSNVNTGQKFTMAMTFGIYLLNIYQNIMTCIKFYKNFSVIHDFFNNSVEYFEYIEKEMNNILSVTSSLKTYKSFNSSLIHYKNNIQTYLVKLKSLQPYRIKDIFKIGKKMKLFYECKHNQEFIDTTNYSFGLIGFLDNINGLQHNLREKHMNFGKYSKETSFKNFFHPTLLTNRPIKNNIKLNKNYIISGPNASGKTTLLKSILINTILTQQVYCGFYKSGKVKFVDKFHCYLNIPDTNARDSLFQAEARRCKEIIDIINSNTNENHFCIFDELYSGTNPFEAVGSAHSYLSYLSEKPNVKFMLTTHFLKLCNMFENSEVVKNIKMKSCLENNNVNYYYLIEQGISNVQSGFQVLKKLDYPKEILDKVFSFN